MDEEVADWAVAAMERLKSRFDDEIVQQAMARLESGELGCFENEIIRSLLEGRGAKSRWEILKARLTSNPDLSNIAKLVPHISQDEKESLRCQAEVDDKQLIEEISAGHFPPLYVLENEHRQKLMNDLRELISTRSSAENEVAVLEYLLSSERSGANNSSPSAETIRIAQEWCLEYAAEEKVQSILGKLLYHCQNEKLKKLAERQIHAAREWKIETVHLLTALMACSNKRKADLLAKFYFEACEYSDDDAWVIYCWNEATCCGRRSFAAAREVLDEAYPETFLLFRCFAKNLSKRHVRRWILRYIRRNRSDRRVRNGIRELIYYRKNRHFDRLAVDLLSQDDLLSDHLMLNFLLRRGCSSRLIEIVQTYVSSYPNAPASFHLMLRLCRIDPVSAVPWVLNWLDTAMPEQVCQGLTSIIESAATGEWVKHATDWYLANADEGISPWYRASLLDKLLEFDNNLALRDAATRLLQSKPLGPNRNYEKLAKRLASMPL